jgi:hypothetical protein
LFDLAFPLIEKGLAMRSRIAYLMVMNTCMLAVIQLGVATADATSISVSATAPTVDNADIACLVGETSGSYLSAQAIYNDWPGVCGQTFTTGDNADGYNLNAVTLQVSTGFGYDSQPNTGPYNIQVGSVSGTVLTPITTVTTPVLTPIAYMGNYVTVTFSSPVHLAANSVYGFDAGIPAGNGGFVPAKNDGNPFSGGAAYSSGTVIGTPNNSTLSFYNSSDRVFHLDMVAGPAVPEPSTIVLLTAGMVGLLAYAWKKRK